MEENGIYMANKDVDGDVKTQELTLWSDKSQSNVFTFIDLSSMRGKALAAKGFSAADVTKKQMEQEVFMLENFLVHDAVMTDEKTGTKNVATRAVLYNRDGLTAAFVSVGILGTLQRFVSLFGVPPWKPAIPVKLRESTTRMGYRVYSLEVIYNVIED